MGLIAMRVSASNAKSPIYIATQYGEGYVWIATQSRSGPIDAFLIIEGERSLARACLKIDIDAKQSLFDSPC
ncbi:hypothetical protein [Rhizobium sp. 1399]|jgi:hypothetical protein|uniref:hypothetical protein n=1 Tax=Rhizobium sp. 1399 TaxID=2817758 RepID=UPI0028639891|nr:hypothetical protein [Rhizobium sp. 1399]MDR6669782.1 hypothetical protein [Rhizobium sp. 1399]